MSATTDNEFAQDLFAGLPSRYELLAEVLSLGQNGRWRRAMVDRAVAGSPGLVCDVATGTARVARELRERGAGRVVGVDLSLPMLSRGRDEVSRDEDVALVAGRAEQLPFPDATFDALTFTYLLRYVADPAATISELARVVRPGGILASLEFHVPQRPVWTWAWRAYTRAVLPVAGALLGGAPWARVGRFLGPNIEAHYAAHPVERTVAAWRAAGLVDVGVRTMSLGGGIVMWGRVS